MPKCRTVRHPVSSAMPEYDISGTCWTAGGLPFSWTTSPSPLPWQGFLTRGQHVNPGSCPTWRNIRQISATSRGQPTWWQIPSPGRPDMWRRGASLGGNLCKSALRVSGCSLAERQTKLLSTFTTWRGSRCG
jgi:hypothetical protein